MLSTAATTEARILDAAAALFCERGYHAATMRDLAAEVGIKAGSLYNHTTGKEELLFRIAHGVMSELLEGGRAAIAGRETPRDALRALILYHVVYHAENRERARVADEQLDALSPGLRAEVVALRDAYDALFKELLAAGRDEHGWIVESVPVLTFGIGGMCTWVDAWYRPGGPLSAAEIGAIYAGFVLRGLEPQ